MQHIAFSKLIALFISVVVAGIILLSAWSYYATNKIKIGSDLYYQIIEANDVIADILPPPQYIVEAFLLVHQMRTATPSEQAALKKRFDETQEEFNRGQERWRKSDLPKSMLDAITAKTAVPAQSFYKEAAQIFFPALTNQDEVALNASMKKLEGFYQQNRLAVVDLVSAVSDRKAMLEKTTVGEIDQYHFWFYTVAVSVVGLCLFVAFNVIGIIRARVDIVIQCVRSVAGGNLRVKASMPVDDEFGEIANELNNMIQQFRTIVMQLNTAAEQLAVSAEQSESVCRVGVNDIQEQHHMSLQLASGMTQMSSAIDGVSRGSTETLARVEQVRSATAKGIDSMQQHITKVHNIANNIERASVNVEQLSELSNTIGSVLDVIRGIAEQTNLLALNAAIEAARAGEQGRGFAVVADEVRTLASRTGNSTTEIQQMIERLQSSTQEAVRDMILSREDAKSGVGDVASVGELLRNLSSSVEGIHLMNIDMAQSAEEQSSVTKEFDRSLRSLTQLTDKTYSGMKEIKTTAESLSKLATAQRKLVEQFMV